jgi:hypothetical protein
MSKTTPKVSTTSIPQDTGAAPPPAPTLAIEQLDVIADTLEAVARCGEQEHKCFQPQGEIAYYYCRYNDNKDSPNYDVFEVYLVLNGWEAIAGLGKTESEAWRRAVTDRVGNPAKRRLNGPGS